MSKTFFQKGLFWVGEIAVSFPFAKFIKAATSSIAGLSSASTALSTIRNCAEALSQSSTEDQNTLARRMSQTFFLARFHTNGT
jgi:hypothetical protein